MQLQGGGVFRGLVPHYRQSYHHIFLNLKKPNLGRMRGGPRQAPGLQQSGLPVPEAASKL